MASRTPGAGRADSARRSAPSARPRRGAGRTKYSWKATSGPSTGAPGSRTVVGHGHQVDADAPGAGQLRGDLAQGGPLGQSWCGRSGWPRSLSPSRNQVSPPVLYCECLHDRPGLPGQSPPGLGVDGAGQGVESRCPGQADVEPVQLGVIAGVDDGGDLWGGTTRTNPRKNGRRRHLRQGHEHPGQASGPIRRPGGRPSLPRGHRGGSGSVQRAVLSYMCKAPCVPPERSATAETGTVQPVSASDTRLSVALDATPLLGRPTGVGVFCAGALGGLAQLDDVDVSAFAISWRRRQGCRAWCPRECPPASGPCPPARCMRPGVAGACPRSNGSLDPQVVHGTNFVVPPARRPPGS